jgi:hypothetical protein
MSLYNYEGWTIKYLVNRSLTCEERLRLQPTEHSSLHEPQAQWTTIAANDVYVESVDKFYAYRGITALFGLPLLTLVAVMSIVFPMTIFENFNELVERGDLLGMLAGVGFSTLLTTSATIYIARVLLQKEVFAYTHYPVRLNRKNRLVYVFRHNGPGGVLVVKWKEVLWEIAHCKRSDASQHEIRGHVMDPDGVTVRDTFPLGVSDSLDVVQGQWEHFRRYMEGGAGQVKPQQLLPLANRREPFWFGMRRCAANVDLHPIVVLVTSPLWASIGWVRGLVMRTCRVPRWPADVIEACEAQVRPGELMRKKDSISSSFGAASDDWLSRVVMVVGVFAGGACGAAFWYWVFTGSGFTKTVGELFEMIAGLAS